MNHNERKQKHLNTKIRFIDQNSPASILLLAPLLTVQSKYPTLFVKQYTTNLKCFPVPIEISSAAVKKSQVLGGQRSLSAAVVEEAVATARADWNSLGTSWEFKI